MTVALRDKRLVAQAFSRAAQTYDSVAWLQREVASRLLQQLPAMQPRVVLDLGSGTGYASAALRGRYPQAQLISLDLAEGMLAFSRQRGALSRHHHLCADAEQLPLADGSVDLIFSSLAIQWCQRPRQLFAELARVLRPGGRLLVATLGPATLHELKHAWAAVDEDPHVNAFLPLPELTAAAQGMRLMTQSTALRVLEYERLGELMHELKALGAHNVNPRRQRGLAGPARLRILTRAYDALRLDNGQLPASYEIYYLDWIRETG